MCTNKLEFENEQIQVPRVYRRIRGQKGGGRTRGSVLSSGASSKISSRSSRRGKQVSRLSSREESERLLFLHRSAGCLWKQLSANFPGVTDSQLKNFFFALVRKGLRKARKLGSQAGVSDPVGTLKPRVLASFAHEELPIEGEDRPPWLQDGRVVVEQFILHFAFSENAKGAARDPEVGRVVDIVFARLEEQNREYLHSSTPTAEAPVQEIEPMTESQLFRSESIRSLGSTFLAQLQSAQQEMQRPKSRERLSEIFSGLARSAGDLSALLESTARFRLETRALSEEFVFEPKVLSTRDSLPPQDADPKLRSSPFQLSSGLFAPEPFQTEELFPGGQTLFEEARVIHPPYDDLELFQPDTRLDFEFDR